MKANNTENTENREQDLANIRAEWLLALREQEAIQHAYKQELELLQQKTQQALAPSQAKIQECKLKETALLQAIETTQKVETV